MLSSGIGAVVAPSSAAAVPGNPGTPSAGTVLYLEDFENVPNGSNTTLTSYVSDDGIRYGAEFPWDNRLACNGLILDVASTRQTNDCIGVNGQQGQAGGTSAFDDLRRLAHGLGTVGGTNPNTNSIAASYTSNPAPGANKVQFRTLSEINLAARNRFVTFSVDAIATNCFAAHPLLRFYLTDNGVEHPVSTSAIDPCTQGRAVAVPAVGVVGAGTVSGGRFPANGSFLVQNNSFGIVMRNETATNAGNDGAYDNIRVLDVTPQLDKSFSPARIPVGGTSTLTFTVTNTSELAAKNGWGFIDNLPEGLTIADTPNVGGTCTATTAAAAGDDRIAISGGVLVAGQASCTVTVDVTSEHPRGAEPSPRTYNNCPDANVTELVGLNPPACASLEVYSEPKLSIVKTSNATARTRIGDTVSYRIQIANAGTGDFTTAAPARIQDDLSGVLDDAEVVGEAGASSGEVSISEAAERLTWTGPLAVGDVVDITYQVKLTGPGDYSVRNVAFQTACADGDEDCNPTPPPAGVCADTGTDPETGLPCDSVTFGYPHLRITKSAVDENGDPATDLPAVGDTVTYTVTATNDGTADYTRERPAVVLDDLAAVLDDGTLDERSLAADRGNTLDVTDQAIRWTGALAQDETVTITYEVTYTGAGDTRLINVAFGPQCNADDPMCDDPPPTPRCDPADANGNDPETGEPCGRLVIPAALLDVTKSVDPEKGATVVGGEELTYTITFTNSGTATAEVRDWVDDLGGVLDDAEIVTGPAASHQDLTVSAIADGRFTVGGTVPAGETYTVTYTAKVGPDGERGDNRLANFVLPPGVDEPPAVCLDENPLCTQNPVPEIVDSKTVDPATGTAVQSGQELRFTLTFSNQGEAAGPVDRIDDLTHLLDDAEITVAPAVSDLALTVSEIADNRYAITGTLAPHQTVTVTYTATVKAADDLGDAALANFLLDPDQDPPTDPGDCAEGDEDCTNNPAPKIIDSKRVDPESGSTVQAGEELTYTLTFSNDGTASGPVNKVDDLTHLLDDAAIVTAPASSDPALSVSAIADNRFSITGTLAPGDEVTVTYTVKVKATADLVDALLGNFLLDPDQAPPTDPNDCEDGDQDCTKNPVPRIVDSKSVDPESGTAVQPGHELTYTLTFTNTGKATGAVDRVDDLTHVLDDAEMITDPSASDRALEVSKIDNARYAIRGDLAAGRTVTVTYTVKVNDVDELGDKQLANFLLNPDQEPPTEPVCDGGEDCTDNPVSDITVTKTTDPVSGTRLEEGQRATYTLTFTNAGTGAGDVDHTDHLAKVLDDAVITESPKASDPALSILDSEDQFTVQGRLAAGQSVTVTYTVQVRDWDDQGDHLLGNFVTVTGQEPPATCRSDSRLCTEHPVDEPPTPGPGGGLPNTGAPAVMAALVAGMTLVAAAGGMLIIRRRRLTSGEV